MIELGAAGDESNAQHPDHNSGALPFELQRRFVFASLDYTVSVISALACLAAVAFLALVGYLSEKWTPVIGIGAVLVVIMLAQSL